MTSSGELKEVNGEYIGTWHAYPKSGYEGGAAVIGIARSRDLKSWTLGEPVLRAQDGAAWVSYRGDLYHFYTAASGQGSGDDGDVRGITVARSRPW